MAIVFKGFFRNKNHWQQKINNLERLESRRWANATAPHLDSTVTGRPEKKVACCEWQLLSKLLLNSPLVAP